MHYQFNTRGTCSTQIAFDIENDRLANVTFVGGCNGNLKAISKLVEGMEANRLVELLSGNTCGSKGTSCADQLATAVQQALKKG